MSQKHRRLGFGIIDFLIRLITAFAIVLHFIVCIRSLNIGHVINVMEIILRGSQCCNVGMKR